MRTCRFFLPFAYGLRKGPTAQGRPWRLFWSRRACPWSGCVRGPPPRTRGGLNQSLRIFRAGSCLKAFCGCSASSRHCGFAGGPRWPWLRPRPRRAAHTGGCAGGPQQPWLRPCCRRAAHASGFAGGPAAAGPHESQRTATRRRAGRHVGQPATGRQTTAHEVSAS